MTLTLILRQFDVFLYPFLAVWLERRYYDAREPPSAATRSWTTLLRSSRRSQTPSSHPTPTTPLSSRPPEALAIVIKNLSKSFDTAVLPSWLRPSRWFSNSHSDSTVVTAIADLSLTVPRGGIFVLLGSNGAGKSTVLSVLAGLTGRTGGRIAFPPRGAKEPESKTGEDVDWDGPSLPPKGALGIVPQKNVLFPELTCLQTLQLWSAIKRPSIRSSRIHEDARSGVHVEKTAEELERLLADCGLEGKLHENAGSLSGGQKRKLQLTIGLVGGSESEWSSNNLIASS